MHTPYHNHLIPSLWFILHLQWQGLYRVCLLWLLPWLYLCVRWLCTWALSPLVHSSSRGSSKALHVTQGYLPSQWTAPMSPESGFDDIRPPRTCLSFHKSPRAQLTGSSCSLQLCQTFLLNSCSSEPPHSLPMPLFVPTHQDLPGPDLFMTDGTANLFMGFDFQIINSSSNFNNNCTSSPRRFMASGLKIF